MAAPSSASSSAASTGNGLFKLRAMTFNIWAVPFVGAATDFRIEEILAYLKRTKGSLDIIGFQEVYSLQALKRFHEELPACGFPYLMHFGSGSGLPSQAEGSGLLIASVYPIIDTSYHTFSVGGRPFAITEFDWHSSKGIGLARILLPDEYGSVDVYCSHLQAQYSDDAGDTYHDQRVMQAFECASFIRSTRRSDLTLFLVDANSNPDTQVYRTLTTLAGFRDVYSMTHTSESELVSAATGGGGGGAYDAATGKKKHFATGGTLTATRAKGGFSFRGNTAANSGTGSSGVGDAGIHPSAAMETSRMMRSIYDSTFGNANNRFSYLWKKQNKNKQQQQQAAAAAASSSSSGNTPPNSSSSSSPPLKSQQKNGGRERAGSLFGRQRLFSDAATAEAAALAQEQEARQSWYCCPALFDRVERLIEGASAPPNCDVDARLDYVFIGTGSPSWPFVVAPFSVNLLHRTWHALHADIRCTQLIETPDGREINLSDHSAVFVELGCVILAPTLVQQQQQHQSQNQQPVPMLRHQNSAPAALSDAAAAAAAAESEVAGRSAAASFSEGGGERERERESPAVGGTSSSLVVAGLQVQSPVQRKDSTGTAGSAGVGNGASRTGGGSMDSGDAFGGARKFSEEDAGGFAPPNKQHSSASSSSSSGNSPQPLTSFAATEAMLKQALLAAGVPLDRCAAYLPGEMRLGRNHNQNHSSASPPLAPASSGYHTGVDDGGLRQRKGAGAGEAEGKAADAPSSSSSSSSSAIARRTSSTNSTSNSTSNNSKSSLYSNLLTSLSSHTQPLQPLLTKMVSKPLLALKHWDRLSIQALKPLMEMSARHLLSVSQTAQDEISTTLSFASSSTTSLSSSSSSPVPVPEDPATKRWLEVLDETIACIERGRQRQEELRLKQVRGGHLAVVVGLVLCLYAWWRSATSSSSFDRHILAGAANAALTSMGFIWAYATIMRTATLPVAVGRLVTLVLTGIALHTVLYRYIGGFPALALSFGVGLCVFGILCYFNGAFLSSREVRDYARALSQLKILKTRPPGVVA